MKFGNYFLEFFNMTEARDNLPRLLMFDIMWFKGYVPLTTLKKAHYNNYVNIDFDLFRQSFQVSFGLIKPVDYELGFKKFKEHLKRNVK